MTLSTRRFRSLKLKSRKLQGRTRYDTAILSQWLRAVVADLSPVTAFLLTGWLLTMIGVPILRWVWGETALRYGVITSVCLLVGAVTTLLIQQWGGWRTVRVISTVVILAWALEFLGHTTGYPFGSYDYTSALQPQLGGVPLLIPLAWLMLLPAAWGVSQAITGETQGIRFVLVSAGAFTAWDFFLDPQMVGWGYWVWDTPGGYFGIPWVNFLGWFLGSAFLTAAARPTALPQGPLLLIYIVTWFLQSIGQALFWQMPGPAAVGCLAMGFFIAIALLQQQRYSGNRF